MADVYVVGSLNSDHRVRVDRIPRAGETILGSEIVVGAGGKGANQAAGDTFIGYLAAGLAQDAADLIGACEIAVHAAALAVTREGAIDSIPFSTKGHP